MAVDTDRLSTPSLLDAVSTTVYPAPGNLSAGEVVPQLPSREIQYAIFVFNGVLALIGLVGNVFVCMIIIRGRKMYTIANLFLLNLSVADMCVLLISYPIWVVQFFRPEHWPFGPELCKILPAVSDCFYGVSLGCMMTISIHRYRMIVHAMKTQLTFFQAKLIVILIWLVSLGTISIPLYPVMTYQHGVFPTLEGNMTVNITVSACYSNWGDLNPQYEQGYQLALFIGWYIVPLLVILITFLLIRFYLRRQMLYGWLSGNEQTSLISKQIMGIKKALRMLAPVVVIFAILMLPWNMLRMVTLIVDSKKVPYFTLYMLISGSLLVANSVINPFIYYIFSQEFRLEFRKQFWLLRKCLHIDRYDSEFIIHRDPSGQKFVRRFDSVRIRKFRRPKSTASNGSVSKRRPTIETKCSSVDLRAPSTPSTNNQYQNYAKNYFDPAPPSPSPFMNYNSYENTNGHLSDSGVYSVEQDDVFLPVTPELCSLMKIDMDNLPPGALAPASHLSMIAEESSEIEKDCRDFRLSLFFRPSSVYRILSEQDTRESTL